MVAHRFITLFSFFLGFNLPLTAQNDPATEPTVLAVKKTLPAVVNINTERVVRSKVYTAEDAFFYEFFGGPMRPPRELRQTVQSLGSGFLVDPEGYIVTNEHVVERAAELKIKVTTTEGKTYDAKYITGDPEADIALIKIEGEKPFPFISLEDLSPNHLGQTVIVLGNPLGYGSSVSRGILSALNRSITIDELEFKDLLQTDAAINPGNSGGPVIDVNGRLVGVSSVKMAYTPQGVPTQGIGFAIPGATIRDKITLFKKTASRQPLDASPKIQKLFGIQVQDLTKELTEAFGYKPESGVLVCDVEPKSPAAQVGLQRGLVIYKVGRYEVNSVAQMEEVLSRAKSGSAADFEVGAIQRIGGRYLHRVQTVSLTAR